MNMMAIAAFTGVLTVVLAAGALSAGGSGRQRLKQRAKALRRPSGEAGLVAAGDRGQSLLRSKQRTMPLIETLAERFVPNQVAIRNRLARTGYDVSVGTYALICAVVAVIAATGLKLLAGLPLAAAVLGGLAAGALLPHVGTGIIAKRRRAAFMTVFPEAVALMVRGVKSGLPITETMAVVGQELPAPVGSEFRRISDHIRLGSLPETVLMEAAQRLDIPEFKFFVITLSIQRETGGNLTESLTNLGDLLRSRRQMKLKVKAMSSEAKASAYILGALPILMFVLINALNPDYASLLYTDPRGKILLGGAIASMLTAAAVMTKMIRFEI
jgi:tight adherence protein B